MRKTLAGSSSNSPNSTSPPTTANTNTDMPCLGAPRFDGPPTFMGLRFPPSNQNSAESSRYTMNHNSSESNRFTVNHNSAESNTLAVTRYAEPNRFTMNRNSSEANGFSVNRNSAESSVFTVNHNSTELNNRSLAQVNNGNPFVTHLLQAVCNGGGPSCSICSTYATFKCRDCSELLCEPCVGLHRQIKISKNHAIVSLSERRGTSTSASLSVIPRIRPYARERDFKWPTFCKIHHDRVLQLFCETCVCIACTECAFAEHRGHKVQYVDDANSTRTKSLKLRTETLRAISIIRQAIYTNADVTEQVGVQAQRTEMEVKQFTQRYIEAVKERQEDLLRLVEKLKQAKLKALKNQVQCLNVALNKLLHSSSHLNESLEQNDNLDIMLATETAALNLEQLRSMQFFFVPRESEYIFYSASDAIKNVQSLGHVHDRPTNLFKNSIVVQTNLSLGSIYQSLIPAMGRPIYGLPHSVITKDSGGLTSLVFGKEGSGDGQLCRPWGVCCDNQGRIFVADRSNNRIQVFDQNGVFLYKFGSHGSNRGQFNRPAGLTIDNKNRLIVADKDNHRLQIFTLDGTCLQTIGEKGNREGQFNYPWDVAANAVGSIVVSDTRNHRVQLFSSDGAYLAEYGFSEEKDTCKHFDSPRGVCFTPTGNVLVTDFNHHRIVCIDGCLTTGIYIGMEGDRSKQFLRPQGIICDDDGRIIVADSKNHRIQVFEANSTFLWKCGTTGRMPGEFDRPSGICLNPDGQIIVVDFGNNRVQIF